MTVNKNRSKRIMMKGSRSINSSEKNRIDIINEKVYHYSDEEKKIIGLNINEIPEIARIHCGNEFNLNIVNSYRRVQVGYSFRRVASSKIGISDRSSIMKRKQEKKKNNLNERIMARTSTIEPLRTNAFIKMPLTYGDDVPHRIITPEMSIKTETPLTPESIKRQRNFVVLDLKSQEKIILTGKILKINKNDVIIDCVINNKMKIYEKRRFDIEPFRNIFKLEKDENVRIEIYTLPGYKVFKFSKDIERKEELDKRPNLFNDLRSSKIFD